jgi:hypothetical protein
MGVENTGCPLEIEYGMKIPSLQTMKKGRAAANRPRPGGICLLIRQSQSS